MSSPVGTYPEFVNAQKMTLENTSDNKKYTQIQNLIFDLRRDSHFKSLTDATMERLYGVADNALEFDITLTVGEVASFITLAKMTNQTTDRTLPEKDWKIEGTAENNTKFSITFKGSVVIFRTIRPLKSASSHHVRIEASSITVTVA
jgi:hypothetical protein